VESCITNRHFSSRPNRNVVYLAPSIVQHDPTIGEITIERPEIPNAANVATSDIHLGNVVTTFANSLGDSCNAHVDGIHEYKDDGDFIAILGCREKVMVE